MNNTAELKTGAPLGELRRFWLDAQKNGDTFTSNDDFVQRYISYRNKKEMNEIRAEFSAQFGSAGESIAAEPAFSEKLNGGLYSYDDTKAENPHQYFIGMPYSLPLIVYMMRRSLDTPEDIAFDRYIQSVHNMADELKEPLYSLPTRSFIEELTAPYLVRIQELREHNFDNTITAEQEQPHSADYENYAP